MEGNPHFQSPLESPQESIAGVLDPASHLPDDSNDELSSLVGSPESEASAIGEGSSVTGGGPGADFTKMSVYSPTQEAFSIPEDIGTEAQTSTSLSSPAVSDVQGAKHYLGDGSEYPMSTTATTSSEQQQQQSANFFSPSTTRPYSFSQPGGTMAHSPLVSPSPYPSAAAAAAAFNIPPTFPTPGGGADGMMTSMYPNGACMSPSAYMSPYSAGKQYTWPTTPNGAAYGTFGMNSHDLMQAGAYATTYPSAAAAAAGSYSQMAAASSMSRSGYPAAAYFPPQVTATTHTAT